MELKIKNANKKPAMALVLIIIIITSLTVVIMGTLKIITASSGKFSIDRNAKGTMNIKKPLGKYLCFNYGNKLYEIKISYNSDGSVLNRGVYPVDSGNCKFGIPTGTNQFKVTLIGGGSGGAQSTFNNLSYLLDKDKKGIFLEDILDLKDYEDKNVIQTNDGYKIKLRWFLKDEFGNNFGITDFNNGVTIDSDGVTNDNGDNSINYITNAKNCNTIHDEIMSTCECRLVESPNPSPGACSNNDTRMFYFDIIDSFNNLIWSDKFLLL